jgi:hypothetical protein
MNEHIERERYLTESRDNAARMRIRERQLTREERIYRQRRIVHSLIIVLWLAFILGILLWNEPTPEVAEVAQEEPIEVAIEVIEEDPKFDVEAVEAVFDPVREDVPLDAETQRLLYQACDETGIRYELALAVIWQETDFRNIMGDGGESAGYMQIQEKHHGDRMARLGVTDLFDPYSNFLVGCDYLAELAAKGKGIEWMLMAYNGGPSYANNMAEAGSVSQYVRNVLNHMAALGEV